MWWNAHLQLYLSGFGGAITCWSLRVFAQVRLISTHPLSVHLLPRSLATLVPCRNISVRMKLSSTSPFVSVNLPTIRKTLISPWQAVIGLLLNTENLAVQAHVSVRPYHHMPCNLSNWWLPSAEKSMCLDYVNNNPSAFREAYFDFAALRIYSPTWFLQLWESFTELSSYISYLHCISFTIWLGGCMGL